MRDYISKPGRQNKGESHIARSNGRALAGDHPERPRVQRSLADQGNSAQVSKIGDQVSSSSGHPLDSTTRTFFEQRFGHDFSGVRVHTNTDAQASAASENAIAYTRGSDVVFGASQYRPHTLAGRWLIGHELAHVIQQRGSTSHNAASERALEREAGNAAMRAVFYGSSRIAAAQSGPAIQFARVSDGGFGKALEEFTDGFSNDKFDKSTNLDTAVPFLKGSSAFMALVKILDDNYIWPNDPAFHNKSLPKGAMDEWEVGQDGRMLKPASAAGKRPIYIRPGEGSFRTINDPDNGFSGDLMKVSQTPVSEFIQDLVHEATHAAKFVGGSAPNPKTLADAITAGIQDEISARTSEGTILGQVSKLKNAPTFKQVGSTVPREVERDVSPAFNLTYLELFFFSRKLQDLQAKEGMSDDEARGVRGEVDQVFPKHTTVQTVNALPLGAGNAIFRSSEYADTWFNRKTATKEWEDFAKKHSRSDPDFLVEREKVLQDHAKRFLDKGVSYTP